MSKNTWKCDKCNSIIKEKNYHEITEKDLLIKSIIKIQGESFPSFSIFGGLRSFDVGRRLYLINGILYIENQEQFENRVEKDNKSWVKYISGLNPG